MNELIKITQNNEGNNVVDARELHVFLEVKSKFATWISNRINKFGFVENQDFIPFSKNLENGGRSKEYAITINMAKELAMVENNEKGKQARRYFIEAEKAVRSSVKHIPDFSNPAEAARAWADQYEQKLEAQKQLQEARPKIERHDSLMSSQNSIPMQEAASYLAYKGLGRNNLFKLLRERGILNSNNLPYRKYIESGMFKCVVSTYIVEGVSLNTNKTLVTPKGLGWMDENLIKLGYTKILN